MQILICNTDNDSNSRSNSIQVMINHKHTGIIVELQVVTSGITDSVHYIAPQGLQELYWPLKQYVQTTADLSEQNMFMCWFLKCRGRSSYSNYQI